MIQSFGRTQAATGDAFHEDSIFLDDGLGVYAIGSGPPAADGEEAGAKVFTGAMAASAPKLSEGLARLAGDRASWRRLHEPYSEIFDQASGEVRSRAVMDGRVQSSGTTVVVHGAQVALAHVGRTRAYFIRQNRLVRLTRDPNDSDDADAEEQTLVAIPSIVKGGREVQWLGQPKSLRVDGIVFKIQPGDRVILVSAAIGEVLRGEQIFRQNMSTRSPEALVDALLNLAVDQNARPDLSCIVLGFEGAGPAEDVPAGPPKTPRPTLHGTEAQRAALFDQLRRVDLFAGLGDEQLSALVDKMVTVTLEPGQVLYEPGDDSDRLYLVTIGQIIERLGETVVTDYGPWEVVGIRALFEQEARTLQATSASLSRLKAIKRSDLMAAIARDQGLAARLYHNLAGKLLHLLDRE